MSNDDPFKVITDYGQYVGVKYDTDQVNRALHDGQSIELREALKQLPPKFTPGDYVVLKPTFWPPKSENLIKSTGLYNRPGFPIVASGNVDSDGNGLDNLTKKLNLHLNGIASNGDRCLVVAVVYHEEDKKWYYLLNSFKPKGFGWTRCAFRLERV